MSYKKPDPRVCSQAEWTIHRGLSYPACRYGVIEDKRWLAVNAIIADITDRRGLKHAYYGLDQEQRNHMTGMLARVWGDVYMMAEEYLRLFCELSGSFSNELGQCDEDVIQDMKDQWIDIFRTVIKMEELDPSFHHKQQFIRDVKTRIDSDPIGEKGTVEEYDALRKGAGIVLDIIENSTDHPGYKLSTRTTCSVDLTEGLTALFHDINT